MVLPNNKQTILENGLTLLQIIHHYYDKFLK